MSLKSIVLSNPTEKHYCMLLNIESILVQTAELYKEKGYQEELAEVLEAKKKTRILRICTKAALKLKKEKAESEATQSA
ncbi:hypothetical protein [Alkalihalophilus marmarensis]|uniref:hypothetical protein n=1 Tax=Alkalihalophilus marmarensis TaxID=521377 RepID=UPI002E1C4FFE|nr:hypothetical protein [Alkalihalophilus marmarensis]